MNLPAPLTDGQESFEMADDWLKLHQSFGAYFSSSDGYGGMCPASQFTPTLYQNDLAGLKFSRSIEPDDTAETLQSITEFATMEPIKLPELEETEKDWQIRGMFPISHIRSGQDEQTVKIERFDGSTIKWCIENARLFAIRGDSKTVMEAMRFVADFPQPQESFWQIRQNFRGDICLEFEISNCN